MWKPVLLLVLSAGSAAPGYPAWPHPYYVSGESHCTKALPDGVRTLLGIRMDKSTLASFERVLGASPLRKEGDGGEFFASRCWEAANGDGTVLVVGRGDVHAEFRVIGREMTNIQRGTCPKSKLVSRDLATANGVRLGLTRAQVERKVGPASKAGDGWFERACLSERPMTKSERARLGAGPSGAWDVSGRMTVVQKDDRVEAIRVMWAVTY